MSCTCQYYEGEACPDCRRGASAAQVDDMGRRNTPKPDPAKLDASDVQETAGFPDEDY